jgi:hypothetical protein
MKAIWMRFSVVGALVFTPVTSPANAAPLPGVVLYKSDLCGCCGKWADHMRAAGFRVTVRNVGSLTTIENRYGVPKGLTSCHTALAGGYVVVGHVPADLVQRLLTERPPVAGISAPGMPQSAPGMDGSTRDHYDVVAFDREGHTSVYARR